MDRPDRPAGRDETEDERLDRLFADILQELRVMQTGAQLTAGFLLTLPFQPRFMELPGFEKGLYVVLVLLAALTTALVLSPVAVHRHLSGRHIKRRVVAAAHRFVNGALTSLSLLLSGMVMLIVDVVVDRAWGIAVGGATLAVLVGLLVVLPRRMGAVDPVTPR